MKHQIDNFTVVLPVTCNADCGFCPEKEMETKENKDVWIKNMVDAINSTEHLGYDHVSISGGEPSLDPRLLKKTIRAIITETHISKIGLTTNGQFLECTSKTEKFLDAISDDLGFPLLDFINISRHAVKTEDNNRIMKVNYKHTMSDIIAFRNVIQGVESFHINTVVEFERDVKPLFKQFSVIQPALQKNNIDVVFRTAYDWQEYSRKTHNLTIPPDLLEEFVSHFGFMRLISECDTCLTYQSTVTENIWLKGATFEPTDHEETARELVLHQDGILYYDWGRNKPYLDADKLAEKEMNDLLGAPTIFIQPIKKLPVDLVEKHRPAAVKVIPTKYVEEEYRGCGFGVQRCGF